MAATDEELEEELTDPRAEPAGGGADTQMLRRMWTHTAGQIVTKIREGAEVDPSEIQDLQKSLENIESRSAFEEARDLTRRQG